MKGILTHFWEGGQRKENGKLNFIGGFDGYTVGNLREIKRLLGLMGVDYTVLGDGSDVWDTPTDGEFRMYDGGTRLDETRDALNARATLSMQAFSTDKTLAYIKEKGQEVVALNCPIGVNGTDRFLMEVSRLTGKPIPDELKKERGRLVDAIGDSLSYLHGKKFAINGDPDFCLGMAGFLLELGAEPVHIVCTNGNKDWQAKMQAVLDASPFGKGGKAWAGKDLWHMRSLLFTEPVDFLIGNSYSKYLERDTKTPMIHIGFPVHDRHHHHRYPIWGYQGALNVLVWILDRIMLELDRNSSDIGKTDFSYDLVR